MKDVKKWSKATADQWSGRATEQKLVEYSEIYGDILLGMHRDMERHQTLIKQHDQNMRQGVARVIQVQAQLSQAVTQAEAHTKNASRFSEEAKSAALAAGLSAKESKGELEKSREFLNAVERKWQALSSTVEGQREQIRTLDSALKRSEERHSEDIRNLDLGFKRFRTRVMWSSAAAALVVIIGGLAWIIHFFR